MLPVCEWTHHSKVIPSSSPVIRNHRTEVSGHPRACKMRVVMKVFPQTLSSLEWLIFLSGSARYSSRLLHKFLLIHNGCVSFTVLFNSTVFLVVNIDNVPV